VAVQVGALKLTVEAEELRLPPRGATGAARGGPAGERPSQRAHAAVRTAANSLDVRGERVDAAIALVEKFLDDALRGAEDAVFVIHGHGTGALRAALREHLGTVPGVARLRPGTPEEGGDGVTVVTLS
jgi:DNA mismatch repair protein MutS2